MRRSMIAPMLMAVLAACALLLAACGGSKAQPSKGIAEAFHAEQAAACARGTMGGCVPKLAGVPRPGNLRGATLIPDVSEYQACSGTISSPGIFRAYEAGTDRQDSTAACHRRELRGWSGAYAFLRPSRPCGYEARRTVEIVKGVGGIMGPVIADAEVWLPPGYVSCFVREVRAAHYPAVTYTAPGTWPGGPFSGPVWVAAYPYKPACFLNACPYVAHQFSDAWPCRGVRGDCSIDEGITSITSKPISRSALLARQRTLRRVLLRDGCRRRVAHREHLGPRCRRWFAEGDRVREQLAA